MRPGRDLGSERRDERAKSLRVQRHLRRRSPDRIGAWCRRQVCAVLRRRHLQYRHLSRPRRHRRRLRHRASATIPIPTAFWRSRPPKAFRRISSCASPAGCPACASSKTARPANADCATGATARRRATCSSCPTGCRIAESLTSARLIYFSGITLSLYSNTRSRPFSSLAGSRAPAGRQGGLRRQFSPARLEGRSRTHPHCFHRGAQAHRYRAADIRRRSRALGRSEPGEHGRAAASLRHRRDRGEERTQQRAGRHRRQRKNSCRCPKCWCRSMPPRPATASMPVILRRGSPAADPATGGGRRASPRRQCHPPSGRADAAHRRRDALAN